MDQDLIPSIEITGPNGSGSRVPLISSPVLIGRSAGCAVQLPDPRVSRHHARLDNVDGVNWRVTDLASENGTRLEGEPLKPNQPVDMWAGCLLEIGPFTLRLLVRSTDQSDRLPTAASVSRPGRQLRLSNESNLIQTLQDMDPPRLAMGQLRCLEEFGRRLLAIESPDQRLTTLCRVMLSEPLGGRWAVVISRDGSETNDIRQICEVEFRGKVEDSPLSGSLIKAAWTRNEPVLATNAGSTSCRDVDAMAMSIAVGATAVAAAVVPLGDNSSSSTRLLYAAFPPKFGTGEWLALCALAARYYLQAEQVWANLEAARRLARIEADLERARQLQARLVPTECDLPGFDVAVRFRPCSGVAGDYVDALNLPDGQALFIIADVVGKGISAAMVAVGIQTITRVAARRWVSLQDLATVLDVHLVATLQPGAFVTLIAMLIDPVTGEIEAVNGGHPPAIVFSTKAGGKCRDIAARGGIMFGPFPESRTIFRDRLNLDETLSLFTDGYFEVFNSDGSMLDISGLCDLIGAPVAAATTSSSAADAVVELTDHWQKPAEPRDDRTLMVIRRKS